MVKTTTLFTDMALREIKSPDRGMLLMIYLKVRYFASRRAGTFNKDIFIKATGLHPRTANKYIQRLIHRGFALDKGNGVYQLIAQNKIIHATERDFLVRLPIDELMSYSWKSIRSFRAFLVECILEQREYVKKKYRNKEFKTVINPKDKAPEKVRNERFLEPKLHHRAALSYGKSITGLSTSTLSKYRVSQKVSEYKWTHYVIYNTYTMGMFPKLISKLNYTDGTGKEFHLRGGRVFVSEISKRSSTLEIRTLSKLLSRPRIPSKKEGIPQTLHFSDIVPF